MDARGTWGNGMYFLTIILGALIAVSIHELGHLLVARLLRVQVEGVTIGLGPELFSCTDRHGTRWRLGAWPIGGKCDFTRANPTPGGVNTTSEVSIRSKATIYFAGSASNLLLTLLCAVVAGWPDVKVPLVLDATPTPEGALLILAFFSASLGLFNLLPMLPMDGGLLVLTALERARGKGISDITVTRLNRTGIAIIALATVGILLYAVGVKYDCKTWCFM